MLGCSSPSVLVKSDDPVFQQAQGKLERTSRLLEAAKATAEERTLFMQAESFYRYRFEPPRPSTMAFVAAAAASVTDFPAFQSLAGSLDLLDLRVRAPDSAIQLWETLLLRYPNSRLRPLTLYRLGWAYRSASADGLPRERPEETMDILIKESPASELAGYARKAVAIPWKSKASARNRSLIPGLGQLYVGETHSGLWRLSIAVGAAAAVFIPAYIAAHRRSELTWKRDWPLLATGLGGLIVLSFDYTSSYEDAMRGVVQWNERAEANFDSANPGAP